MSSPGYGRAHRRMGAPGSRNTNPEMAASLNLLRRTGKQHAPILVLGATGKTGVYVCAVLDAAGTGWDCAAPEDRRTTRFDWHVQAT